MIFSSESVFPGHPDKMADQISDAILDSLLEEDPGARAAVEAFVTTGLVVVGGEVTAHNDAARLVLSEAEDTVRDVIREIGYDDPSGGFDWRSCAVMRTIHSQSPDISQGVTEGEGLHGEQGAGDQGLMFGYATDETPSMMPWPIHLSHAISRRMWDVRQNGSNFPWLRPDGKCQVSMVYDGAKPLSVQTVVLSTQHTDAATDTTTGNLDDSSRKELEHLVMQTMLDEGAPNDIAALRRLGLSTSTTVHVNPTGRFVVGGPHGDTGLTGRKIIVDTYGGMGRHGGGAFSGKDPSKVDRSAAYMARHIAKNIVSAGLARRCEIQLAYAIGVADPVGIAIDTFGTGQESNDRIAKAVRGVFPLTPKGLIDHLGLKRPMYRRTAMFGHFGDSSFPWESTGYEAALNAAI